MKNSKYVNKKFGNWTCTRYYLAANYGSSTRHNAYKYVLSRITSDSICDKIISVSGSTMRRIAKGKSDPEAIASKKKLLTGTANEVLYKFVR